MLGVSLAIRYASDSAVWPSTAPSTTNRSNPVIRESAVPLATTSPGRRGTGASWATCTVILCLGAGAAFAVQPVLGSLALDRGSELVPLLGWRYLLAAVVLAALSRRRLRTLPWRIGVSAFGLGVVLYSADSFLFYSALERTSAPFASLLHYAHLALVVGAAAALGRERLDARRLAALVAILGGVALVGGGAVDPDVVGVVLALLSAGVYAVYILASDRLLRGVDPIAYSTLLTAGAAVSFLALGGSRGTLADIGGAAGVGAIVGGALIGSVFALTAFLAGIRLVGPGTASLGVPIRRSSLGAVRGSRCLTCVPLIGRSAPIFRSAAAGERTARLSGRTVRVSGRGCAARVFRISTCRSARTAL